MDKKVMLIDGNSIVNRAFYALPLLSNKNNEYTNAVYGFMNIFIKFFDEEKPDYLGVAFDLSAPTFRHQQYEAYKGTRKAMPEELRPQFPMLKNLLRAMNVPIFELKGYEADDILGTLAQKAEESGYTCVIISGDRDMLQLCTDKVQVRIPKTKGGKTETESYYQADVIAAMGVTPKEYIDVKALMGDASDNIPGVPGIGEKTALKIIQEYHNLENAVAHVEQVKPPKASKNLKEFKEQAVLSKELATICVEVPLSLAWEDLNVGDIFNPKALEEVKRLSFKNLLGRFSSHMKDQDIPSGNDSETTAILVVSGEAECRQIVLQAINSLITAYAITEEEGFFAIALVYGTNKYGLFIPSDQLSKEDLLKLLAPYFQSDVPKISLDSKNDRAFFKRLNIEISNIVFDAMLAGYVLNASRTHYDYDDIAQEFLEEVYPSAEEIFGKGKSRKKPDEIAPQTLYQYAFHKADVIFRAYPFMQEALQRNHQEKLYYEIELPLAQVLMEMEAVGIKVDKDALTAYGQMLSKEIENLTGEIYRLAGVEFNINSPVQLGEILFEKLGLKSGKKTKTGYSTAAEVLEKLVDDHPIIEKIISYRTYAKLNSTYVEGLLPVIDPVTNRIYSTFNQTVTSTGRISSTEPNLQNIPIRLSLGREIRKIFIPESASIVFLDGDYSQIELRVLAHIAGDETLIQAFKEGQDIHRLTASQVFGIPFEEVTDAQRSSAKAVNFGIVYGISGFSLGQDLHITKKEADRYIKSYFAKYPKIKEYLDRTVEKAKEDGYAETIFHRRRNIPELASGNYVQRSFGERVAMNMPIQGSAADIIKIAMVKVYKRLKKEGLQSRIILQVHDELLLEVPEKEIDQVRALLKEEMESAVDLSVPMVVDIHMGRTWFDAK